MIAINSWLNLIQEGTLDHLKHNYDYVFEELDKENEYMELEVTFAKSSKCYRVMRAISKKNDKNQELKNTEKKSTSSAIPFLTLNSFPDGIFLEITQSSVPIFHIIELKRNPVNHIKTISKQFLSAYVHCKFLNSLLHLETDAIYKYYVVFNKEIVSASKKVIEVNNEYNKMRARRVVPGRPQYEPVFNWYKKNTIQFYEFEHKHTFDNIINIPLISSGVKKERSRNYKKQEKLDVFSHKFDIK